MAITLQALRALEEMLDNAHQRLDKIEDEVHESVVQWKSARQNRLADDPSIQKIDEVAASLRNKGSASNALSATRALPDGIPFEDVKAYAKFANEDDEEKYNALVRWMWGCSGQTINSAVNEMLNSTINSNLLPHLTWRYATSAENSIRVVKGSKYADACRAALHIKHNKRHFTDPTVGNSTASREPPNDEEFKEAMKAALKKYKMRRSRDIKKQNSEK